MLSLFNTELRNPPSTPHGAGALCINLLWPRQSIFNFNYFQNSFIICLFCELGALLSWWVCSQEWSDLRSGSGGLKTLSFTHQRGKLTIPLPRVPCLRMGVCRLGPLPIFVSKVLLEKSHTYLLTCLWLFSTKTVELSCSNRDQIPHKTWNIYHLVL